MKSWKNISFLSLSPSAMAVLLSGCLAGENQTFFDYSKSPNSEAIDPKNPPLDPSLSGSSSGTDTGTGTSTLSSSGTDTATLTSTGTDTGTGTGTGTATSTGTTTGTGTSTDISYGYCCNIQSGHTVPASATGCDHGVALIPVTSPEQCIATQVTAEVFPAATSSVKKVDFLFVVDNSGSMADNQARLAEGFETFANAFYRRADLDICTAIITTDRYLGRTGNNNYQRVRTLPCTKPANWSSMTGAEQTRFIDNVIAEFRSKINVGTNGSGTEMAGKSLVTFLYDMNSWNSGVNPSIHTSFFRPDSVANISIVTDENNWFFSPNQAEGSNDIPGIQNALIFNSSNGAVDTRKGIKNYLDEFFAAVQPSHGASYSVTNFLEVTKGPDTIPGLAMNLNGLANLVGRESAKTDIAGSAASFASTYQLIGDVIVQRASAFNVSHDIYEPLYPTLLDLRVTLVKADQSRIDLSNGSNYTVMMPNGISLDAATSATTTAGDRIEVQYRYGITAH